MKKFLISTILATLIFLSGSGIATAQGVEFKVVPVEMYVCTFNAGKDMDDLDEAVEKWTAWADARGVDDYAAWTLTPYYYGPGNNSGFDVIWMGASTDAVAMGNRQMELMADDENILGEFQEVLTCPAHVNYASINYKAPPNAETPQNAVLTLADCNFREGSSFDSVAEGLGAWGEHQADAGSDAGIFQWFPAFGGGAEPFDFKLMYAYADLADLGKDYEMYGNDRGFETYNELVGSQISCDAARAYHATSRRAAQVR